MVKLGCPKKGYGMRPQVAEAEAPKSSSTKGNHCGPAEDLLVQLAPRELRVHETAKTVGPKGHMNIRLSHSGSKSR